MRYARAIWPACALLPLAACDGALTAPSATTPQAPPAFGGPPERLGACVIKAGIRGDYETETFFDEGRPIVTVISGASVSDDQADAANACLAAGSA